MGREAHVRLAHGVFCNDLGPMITQDYLYLMRQPLHSAPRPHQYWHAESTVISR